DMGNDTACCLTGQRRVSPRGHGRLNQAEQVACTATAPGVHELRAAEYGGRRRSLQGWSVAGGAVALVERCACCGLFAGEDAWRLGAGLKGIAADHGAKQRGTADTESPWKVIGHGRPRCGHIILVE